MNTASLCPAFAMRLHGTMSSEYGTSKSAIVRTIHLRSDAVEFFLILWSLSLPFLSCFLPPFGALHHWCLPEVIARWRPQRPTAAAGKVDSPAPVQPLDFPEPTNTEICYCKGWRFVGTAGRLAHTAARPPRGTYRQCPACEMVVLEERAILS